MTKLLGFMPDEEITTEGALLECINLIPTNKGFSSIQEPTNIFPGQLSYRPRGSAQIDRTSGAIFVVGTQTNLYGIGGNGFVDIGRFYTYTPTSLWTFSNFGDVILAANGHDKIQCFPNENGSERFGDITTAPKSKIVLSSNGFVLGFNHESEPDGWACSAIYNHLDWDPDVSTQAANGRLLDSQGEIVTALGLGQTVAVYKNNSVYLGTYVGPPVIWAWEKISDDIGALSPNSVVDIGGQHFIVSKNDFWIFDGSRPYRVESPVKEWFFNNLSQSKRLNTTCVFDKIQNLVFISFTKESTSLSNDTTLVYNIKTKLWGKVNIGMQSPLFMRSPGITYDRIGEKFSKYNDIEGFIFDAPAWSIDQWSTAFFNNDNYLCFFAGKYMPSKIKTWYIGDHDIYTTILNVKPNFIDAPYESSMIHFTSNNLNDVMELRSQSKLINARFNTRESARWHSFDISFLGKVEISKLFLEIKPNGKN